MEKSHGMYEIMGELEIPALSYNPNKTRMKYGGDVLTVFGNTSAPHLYPEKSAFMVWCKRGDGSNAHGFIAIVTEIHFYNMDVSNSTFTIDFSYRAAPQNLDDPTIQTIPAHVCCILAQGDCIGITLGGSEDAIAEWANKNCAGFRHGNKTYIVHNTYTLRERMSTAPNAPEVFVVKSFIASTKTVPNMEDVTAFTEYYIQHVHNRMNMRAIYTEGV